MSDDPINDGGPAFPVDHQFVNPRATPDQLRAACGMSLRDYFAGQALAGFNAQPDSGFRFHWKNLKGEKMLLEYGSTPAGKDIQGWRIVKTPLQAQAESMYAQADAMIEARSKGATT